MRIDGRRRKRKRRSRRSRRTTTISTIKTTTRREGEEEGKKEKERNSMTFKKTSLPGFLTLHVFVKFVHGGTDSPSPIVTSLTNVMLGSLCTGKLASIS